MAKRLIVLGKRAVTADTALRLARFFGTSDRFWLNLQSAYDLDVERDRLRGRLTREVAVLRRVLAYAILIPIWSVLAYWRAP